MSGSSSTPARFLVGSSQVPITPPVGVSLAGYFHDRRAGSVRDDLFARAIVIGNDSGVFLAVVSCDLISMVRDVSEAAKARIEKSTGIPPSRVLISATHTHTGPEVRRNGIVPVNPAWLEALPDRIAQAVEQAAEDVAPAMLHLGACDVEGLAWNRLFRLKDGREVFGKREPDAIIGEAGPVDTSLQTLSALDEEGNLRAVVVNYALHPDVIGGGGADFVSADWPGILCSTLQTVYGADTWAVFLQGAAGDVNHVPHVHTFRPVRGPARAGMIGRALAGAAMTALERAEPMQDDTLDALLEEVPIPYYTRDEELRAEIEALREKEDKTPFERYLVERFDSWPYDGRVASVPVQTLRIGRAGFAAFPAEIFSAIGLEIKRFSPGERTFIVELANDRVSTYIPTGDQARRGAYGAKPILSRWLDADAARLLVDSSLRMLWQLFDAAPPA